MIPYTDRLELKKMKEDGRRNQQILEFFCLVENIAFLANLPMKSLVFGK